MDLAAIKNEFEENGFAVVRQLFSPDEVAEIDAQVRAYIASVVPSLDVGDVFYEQAPSTAIKSLFRMHQHAVFFDKMRGHTGMLEIMRALLPGTIVCMDVGLFGKAAHDGSVTPPHQDNGFSYWEPPHCLKSSIALDAHTSDNGVMICQRGSHKIGVQPHRPSGVAGFSQMLADPLDPELFPEVAVRMEPGDLCLHHTNTVHRSGPNGTDRPRRMVSLIYHSDLIRRNEEACARIAQERERLHSRLT